MFDLNIYPFPPSSEPTGIVPGLLIISPNRKAARGRENDLLVLYFNLEGQSAITDSGLNAWLEKKAEIYHHTAGTVTSGLKAVVDGINSDLFERNTRHAKEGGQVTGHLQMAVVKREMIYFVSLGNGRTLYSLGQENGVLEDNEANSRGLGLMQSVTPRFVQMPLAENDVVIFSFNSPDGWNGESLNNASSLSMEVLFRRLYAQPAKMARGLFIRIKSGSGKANIQTLQPPKAETPVARPDTKTTSEKTKFQEIETNRSVAISSQKEADSQPGNRQELAESENTKDQQLPVGQPIVTRITNPISRRNRAEENRPVEEPVVNQPEIQQDVSAENLQKEPEYEPSFQSVNFKKAVGNTLRKGAAVKNKMDGAVKDTLQKVLPGEVDRPAQIPRSVKIIIALLVPVIVVVVAISLLNRNGRPSYFNAYLQQAEQLAVRADGQTTDQAARLQSLQESLYWLDKAGEYGTSDESNALRLRVQTNIDDLQGIIRINMVSVLPEGFPANTNISQIAATNTDFYALDSTSGQVLRFFASGSGYEQDNNFKCGPSENAVVKDIGPIVDMLTISPDNQYGATLLAVDAKGNLDYCVPGDSGYILSLQAPDMGWGSIKSITMYQNYLYVLDIDGNAVYRFEGAKLEFADKPTLFFDEKIPNLKQAIDIEIVGYELYILRSNGEMVECTYSPIKDMKSTECTDPAPYTDTRGGNVSEVNTFPDVNFVLMRLTQAPDSSIYLLDSKGNTVYHFSYARSLQRVLHPRITDGMDVSNLSPTAFDISSSRVVFMAYKNELFFGQMP